MAMIVGLGWTVVYQIRVARLVRLYRRFDPRALPEAMAEGIGVSVQEVHCAIAALEKGALSNQP